MNDSAKREHVIALVLEQEGIRLEIERLTSRKHTLDTDLDHVLTGPKTTARASTPPPARPAAASKQATKAKSVSVPAKPPTQKREKAPKKTQTKGPAKGQTRGQGQGKAKASQKAAATTDAHAASTSEAPKEIAKAAASPVTVAKQKKVGKAIDKKGPTIKQKMTGALRGHPEGVHAGVLAKLIYGSDDAPTKFRCEQYLYNMMKSKLVGHNGPVWWLVPAKTAD